MVGSAPCSNKAFTALAWLLLAARLNAVFWKINLQKHNCFTSTRSTSTATFFFFYAEAENKPIKLAQKRFAEADKAAFFVFVNSKSEVFENV